MRDGYRLVINMINEYLWSIKYNAFFPMLISKSYISNGWDLSDAIEVSRELFETYSASPPAGKTRGAGSDGLPCWVDVLPIELSRDESIAVAESQKAFLLQSAQQTISLWQTQLQLGMISDSNKQKLIEWMKYIEAVQAVDTNAAPNINWPAQPEL